MKVSNIKEYQLNYLLFLTGFILSVFIIIQWGATFLSDSETYIQAWDNYLSKGSLDPCRTPLYPLIIGFSKYILGNHFQYGVIFIQHTLCLLSAIPFYKLISTIICKKKAAFWFSIAYITISDVTWNSFLMTESLACTGVVFAIYYIYSLLMSASWRKTIILFSTLALLVMLRPAQLYMVAIVGLTAILLIKRNAKGSIALLSVCIGILVVLASYGIQYKKTYGFFSISNVSDINQYYILRSENLISPELFGGHSSLEYEAKMEKGDDSVIYEEVGDLLNTNGYCSFHNKISEIVTGNKMFLLSKAGGRFYRAKDDAVFTHVSIPVLGTIFLIISPHISDIYILLLLFPLFYFHKAVFNKDIACMTVGVVYLSMFANVLLVIIGAQNGWGRLFYPSVPLVIVLFAFILSKLSIINGK